MLFSLLPPDAFISLIIQELSVFVIFYSKNPFHTPSDRSRPLVFTEALAVRAVPIKPLRPIKAFRHLERKLNAGKGSMKV
jgi:hypothetical protein